MRALALALGVLALSVTSAGAGSSTPSTWHRYRADGVSIRYPRGWHATRHPLTHVVDPTQVLAVASYPLPRDSSGADGCEPKEALDRRPPNGVFIYGWEYSSLNPSGLRARDFPPRPKRFTLTGFAHYECSELGYMARFREAGRLFQIHIDFGPRASRATRRTALRILDSLQVASG